MFKHCLNWLAAGTLLLTAYNCTQPEVVNPPEDTPTSVQFKLDPSSWTFESGADSHSFNLETDSKNWKASVSGDWAAVSPQQGNGNSQLTVNVQANEGGRRQLTITFSDTKGIKGSGTLTITQEEDSSLKGREIAAEALSYNPDKRLASTTYQLLVYSFADSDGDGIGDFNGIRQHLDYFRELGVTALWLSPIHPAMSYHGYDVTDYFSVNPDYGSLEDFKALVDEAKEKGIGIYLDYVLNHAGKEHPWFRSAISSPESPYRDYFLISDNPEADIKAGKFDMIPKNGYDAGQWFSLPVEDIVFGTGSDKGYKGRLHFRLDWSTSPKTITVTKADSEEAQASNPSATKWLWVGSVGEVGLYKNGSADVYEITCDVDTEWGFLVRTSLATWNDGTKWGGSGAPLVFGEPYALSNGSEGKYHSHLWTDWFADFNYGKADEADQSGAFKKLAESADQWIMLGVAGLRLDAVKHIYWSATSTENPTFLRKWYEHCNATYSQAGGQGNIYMVGEVFNASDTDNYVGYYEGLPSLFEFSFWWKLRDALNNNNLKPETFVSDIISFHKNYTDKRPGAIPALKLSNHDETRSATELGKNLAKEKQAAAVLLTAEGKPYIYQGEEFGFWGEKDGDGDENIRQPIKWTRSGQVADKLLSGKYDKSSCTLSVEEAKADAASLYNVYKAFGQVRASYKALADGSMKQASNASGVAAWWMTAPDGSKALVVHNLSASAQTLDFTNASYDQCVALLGAARTVPKNGKLYLQIDARSSAVFIQ